MMKGKRKRKPGLSTGAFINCTAYLAGAAVNFAFYSKGLGVILTIIGLTELSIALIAKQREIESIPQDTGA